MPVGGERKFGMRNSELYDEFRLKTYSPAIFNHWETR